ncbi:MAG: hypothetical protein M1827_004733 [Pycnora praestabilis]|nr:MAG: hypothetical protein M1827_004733 [Pycnora praestabilis]
MAAMAGNVGRTNQYFVPGEGIHREVIQADICRYLGNDALVRPHHHQGQTGFLITAYRNLTSEMISDLKADSSRWNAERSQSQRGDGYGGSLMRDPSLVGKPDMVSAEPYEKSTTHRSRQYYGPTVQPGVTSGPNPAAMYPQQNVPQQAQQAQLQQQQPPQAQTGYDDYTYEQNPYAPQGSSAYAQQSGYQYPAADYGAAAQPRGYAQQPYGDQPPISGRGQPVSDSRYYQPSSQNPAPQQGMPRPAQAPSTGRQPPPRPGPQYENPREGFQGRRGDYR